MLIFNPKNPIKNEIIKGRQRRRKNLVKNQNIKNQKNVQKTLLK